MEIKFTFNIKGPEGSTRVASNVLKRNTTGRLKVWEWNTFVAAIIWKWNTRKQQSSPVVSNVWE